MRLITSHIIENNQYPLRKQHLYTVYCVIQLLISSLHRIYINDTKWEVE